MIAEDIGKYDEKQEKRHTENIGRFEDVNGKLNRIIGAVILVGAVVPIVLHFIK